MASLIESRARSLALTAAVLCAAFVGACTEEGGDGRGGSWSTLDGGATAAPGGGGLPGGGTTGGTGLPGIGSFGGGTTGTSGLPGGGFTGGGAPTGGMTGGGTTGGGAGTAGGGGLPCAVKAVVQSRCGSCHGATPASSPMSLVTHAQWHAPATTDKTKQYWELAKVRVNATTKPMPPIEVLTAEEKTTLNNWLNSGAPASNETCNTVEPTPGGNVDPSQIDTTGLECTKFLAHARGNKNAKFPVGAAVDKYLNFGFQAPWQGTVYGVLVRPVIDNASVLHHWLLYREPIGDGEIQETIGQHTAGEMIHGWAPGGLAMDFRKHGDVSFELPGTTYSVEFHYNSSDPNAQDASGVEICYKRQATPNIASLSWLGYDQGGTLSYASGICLNPDTNWTGTCQPTRQEPIHIIFMVPHLHQTGRHLKAVINGPNGSRPLIDKPFDFAYQVSYETDEVLMPGESITTTCTFSAPNCAGQSTAQEMCYLFTYAYPKHALTDQGLEGSFMHGEGVCLGQ